jgi:hypothetical protein
VRSTEYCEVWSEAREKVLTPGILHGNRARSNQPVDTKRYHAGIPHG